MEEEKWVYIDGFNNLYMVSNMGRVMSNNKMKGRIMAGSIAPNGYKSLTIIYPEKVRHCFTIHSLVASHFVDGRTDERNEVNHINGNKLDNRASNLEWCTRMENMTHHRLLNNSGKKFHIKMEKKIHLAWEKFGKASISYERQSRAMKTEFNPRSNGVVHKETGVFYNSLSEAYRHYTFDIGYYGVYQRIVVGKSVFMYI